MILFLFLFLLFSNNCFAGDYAVEKEDGSVILIHYNEGSSDSLQDVLDARGLGNLHAVEIKDLPKDKTDRKYWKLSGVKIVINEMLKQDDLNKTQQLEADKTAILEKLKISKEEFEKLNKKSVTASIN